ncbi:hypothetical protein [Burkholderia sp. Bp9140]|uniref:hypothetical protein n=1 Tax=Burkholderia sp. Bp9140 TaxID=2184572 RepID=UPI0021AB775B|nr:hypothetical protein [Burkholderia sp. Bp9140]
MWHRGDRPAARDLFDLCLVIEREPESLMEASAFLVRHRDTFLSLLNERRAFVRSCSRASTISGRSAIRRRSTTA